MLTRISGRQILHIAIVLFQMYFSLYILLLTGCKHTSNSDIILMNNAERLMEDHPDSALMLLNNVDTNAICSNKDKARYSLLMTMALDKNIMDLNDSILQPAVNYYLKRGTADQKMRTKYYQGVLEYQNENYVKAFTHFLDAFDENQNYTDSLGLALVYAAQGSLYFKQYKIDKYIECNTKAVHIYESYDPDNNNILPTYFRLINGGNINGYSDLVDSVYNICRPKIGRSHPLYARLTGLRMVSLLNFKSKHDLHQFIDTIDTNLLKDGSNLLDLSWSHCVLGNKIKSWEYLCKAEKLPIFDSLKYLAIKGLVLDSLGQYQQSAKTYEKYLDLAMEEEDFLRRSELPYSDKNYSYQLKLAQRKLTITQLLIGILFLSLLIISICFYFYWRRQRDIRKFQDKIEGIKNEKDKLIEELEKNIVSDKVKGVIRKRLDMLNTFITEQIRDVQYEKRSWKKLNALINKDRREFIENTQAAFSLSHPYFIRYLESCGLTQSEIELACLYAIGLRGNEAGEIIGNKSHYNMSAQIRKKLGLYEKPNSMNLNKYLQSLVIKE